jgi:hypothetical protein
MGSTEQTPTWRFRSAYQRAVEAPTANDAVDLVAAMGHGYDRGRTLLAIARRPDLTVKVLTRMLNDRNIGADTQWVNALIQANPRFLSTKGGRNLVSRDVMYSLVMRPAGVEDLVVEYVAGMHHADPTSAEFLTALHASIGADRVRDIAHAYAARDADSLRSIAQSVLMDDDLWQVALDSLPRTKKDTLARGLSSEVNSLVAALSSRPDLTGERAERILAAMHPQTRAWQIPNLFRNPKCPPSAFIAAATGRDNQVADWALSERHCPDEAKFAAVLAGRVHALGAIHRTPIPDNVAEAALAALNDPTRARKRRAGLNEAGARAVEEALARYASSPTVLDGVYQRYLDRHDTKAEAVDAFSSDVLRGHSEHVHTWDPRDRLDVAGEYLAAHADPDLRVTVLSHVHPDDLAGAATDPSPVVRAAVAAHPNIPVPLLRVLAGDADVTVRLAVAAHADVPEAALSGLADDEDAKVREVVASRILTPRDALDRLATDADETVRLTVAVHPNLDPATIAVLAADPSEQVRQIAADRFLTAMSREMEPADA